MDHFPNEGIIVERRKVVEKLEIGKCDSDSQNKEDEAFSLLPICGNLINSK